jgi:hypothetical protein
MLACNIYVDNQEVINYPVSYIMRNLNFVDQFILFGGDDVSYNILKDTLGNMPKVEIINIDKKVKSPSDIAEAQNKCLNHTFNFYKPEYLLSLQADILFTAEGIQQIHDYIVNPITTHTYFRIEHVKLYIKCGYTHLGAVLLNRDCKERFTEDGAYMSGTSTMYPKTACLDIGYLSSEIWAKKLRQHGKTWNSQSALVDAEKYFKDKRSFIIKMSKYVKDSIGSFGLLNKDLDSDWYAVIEELGLIDDWIETIDILKDNF